MTEPAEFLDRDTLLAYARRLFDPSGWKTARYGGPTVRVLIVGGRLQPVNRSFAEIDFALISYSTQLSALAAPLNLLGGSVPALSRSAVALAPEQRAAIHKLTYPLRFMAAETPTHG